MSLRVLPVLAIGVLAYRPGVLAAEAPFDVVIANGLVIDGTGATWYAADVGIRGINLDSNNISSILEI